MADHLRKQIRGAAVTLLTGLTTTGSRVFQGEVYSLANENLPALAVGFEDDARMDESPFGFCFRRATLVVRGLAKENPPTPIEDTLDDIEKEVIAAIGANQTFSGKAKEVTWQSTQIELSALEGPAGIATMRFSAVYSHAEGDTTSGGG